MTRFTTWTSAIGLSLTLSLGCIGGCESTPGSAGSGGNSGNLTLANEAYQQSNYSAAYSYAKPIADSYSPASAEAAYLTGLAAFQLRNGSDAERYFQQAARGDNRTIGAQAMAMIGRIYAGQNRHERAIEAYAVAAQRLDGQDRANALYYTALSQQSMGQWEPARINLLMAKQASNDADFIRKVDSQLSARGWTLQIGAYSNATYAQAAAKNVATQTTGLALGAPRLVPATDAAGRKLVLVQVGQFQSETSAIAARKRLTSNAEVVPMLAAK
jgi:hypothetical protein